MSFPPHIALPLGLLRSARTAAAGDVVAVPQAFVFRGPVLQLLVVTLRSRRLPLRCIVGIHFKLIDVSVQR